MSASEKLKRMESIISEHDRIAATESDGVYAEPLPSRLLVEAFVARMDKLPTALPALIAVVEAAEEIPGLTGGAWPRLAAALAALDDALGVEA